MKRIFVLAGLFVSLHVFAQDTTMNSLTRDMENKVDTSKLPVKIFSSEKAINANTTEMVGKGKMDFKVTHNFGDIGGSNGGIRHFFGLDNATDVKIGFQIGLCDRLDIIASRIRGAENANSYSSVQQLWELGFKFKVIQQMENDSKHPLSLAIFANTAVSSMPALLAKNILPSGPTVPPTYTHADTMEMQRRDSGAANFKGLSDRLSEVIQVIIARKFGKLSFQLIPTYVHRNLVIPGDDKSIFAIGGAARIPINKNFAFLIDYFHTFRSQSSRDKFKNTKSSIYNGTRFYDPLGVGFEITTAGHVFHLNFTNATEILENRFIPRTVTSWGKKQFRWGFTISRRFVLWREKT